ncbi:MULTISPECIES: tyrosinase family oxidase copper chaperone [unclassified Streptomyces]|uniref:tyrosinase family oxidase copper chaperone n=1 Tax=Streptomyces sp. SID8367 TaxID=2690349 RepID=UPI000DB9AD5D|nr:MULTISPECIES: tyrosinase family oxidase copper chaperone [unclassified Streptomyces]MYT73038.1 tyrosinase co-factor [Streptomyces sp. SID8367]
MAVNSRLPLTTGRAPGARALLTRRSAGLVLLGALSATAAVLRMRPRPQRSGPRTEAGETFDEMYRGRRITGSRAAGAGGAWQVMVDGRPLHLMRRADGSYLSMVDHYDSYATPLAAARGAVAELGGQALRDHTGEV